MAVLVDETVMKSDGNDQKNESSHESNVYFDRHLQNKLLQIDEDSDTESYESRLSKSWSNVKLTTAKSSKYDSRTEDITGWFPNAKFIGRRNDTFKPETKPTNTFIHPWKDYRSKKEETFVFKHYIEFRKYMEQYRNQHACHINRYMSGNQGGEMRRMAFQQSSAPSQQTTVTVHQLNQPGHANSAPPASCNGNPHYMQQHRKEQLGTLITPTSNCSCNTKPNAIETSSQSQKYKMVPGQFSRTNTNYDLRHVESENSSECGDLRFRTPSRRTNSASSTRSRTITGKTPTKISVPANPNPRAYPVQALTIQQQQNGKQEAPSPRPLDNLNCVAPEKQSSGPSIVDRKTVDPNLELALRVHSLNDLMTTNEAPLRGYALPKSMPPNPNLNNEGGSELSDTDSDDDISLDQLSTCPLSADVRFRKKLDSQSHHLQKFFKEDPMLRSLNKKPDLQPSHTERQNLPTATQIFDNESFLMSQNDVDAMLRVNMWNPILSMPSNGARRDLASQNYKNLMAQLPFRVVDDHSKLSKSMDSDIKTSYQEKVDCFNPLKKVRLSITRLDNAVSFCRTQVHNLKTDNTEKRSISRATNTSSSFSAKGDYSSDQISMKMKPPMFDPFLGRMTRPTKFEQKLNLPIPHVKILESVPLDQVKRNSFSAHAATSVSNKSDTNTVRPSTGHGRGAKEQPNLKPATNSLDEVSLKDKPSKIDSTDLNESKEPDLNKSNEPNDIKNNVTNESDNKNEDKDELNENEKNKKLDRKEKSYGEIKDKLFNSINDKDNEKSAKPGKGDTDCLEKTIGGLTGMRMNIDNRKCKRAERVESNNQKESARKLLKKPSVASGKSLKSHPELDGLTWTEKLEVLRSVNKPRDKPKIKQQKLKFVKADPKDAMYTLSFNHEHLYEQRRIKHLVEQARIKGGKQLDWVYEAQVKSRGVDWDLDTLRENEGVMSGDSSEDEGAAGDNNLEKYGICVAPDQVKQRLFSTHRTTRSKTYVAP